jgi:hypothetical protein
MTRLGRAAPSRKPFSVPLRQLFWGYSAPPLREYSLLGPVWRIRVGFNADSDPAFYLHTDPDPGSKTNSDQCVSGSESLSEFAVTKSLILTFH